MAHREVAAALRTLGIGEPAARLYAALLAHAPAPLREVGARAGLAEEQLAHAYGELADAGLVGSATDEERTVAPASPETALRILTRLRSAEIDESGLAVSDAFEVFRRQRLTGPEDRLVEIVTGHDVGVRVRQAWLSARREIRQFDTPPYFPLPTGVQDAVDTLDRGVVNRVVYSRASLEVPGNLTNNIETAIAAGEQARLVGELPVKLIIIDDSLALVSLSMQEAEVHHTVAIVRPSGLFSALVALFEQTWHNASSLREHTPAARRLLPADRRLLSLLSAGVADDDIARELGISRRTLFRRVEVLMARLGSRTRFQMAVQAQQRGWL